MEHNSLNKLIAISVVLAVAFRSWGATAQQPPNYPQFQVVPFNRFVPSLPPANLPLGPNDFIPLVQGGNSKRIPGNQVGGGCPAGVIPPGTYNPVSSITVGSNGCVTAIGGAATLLTGGGVVLTGGGVQLSE
jgi:hypothetical protein